VSPVKGKSDRNWTGKAYGLSPEYKEENTPIDETWEEQKQASQDIDRLLEEGNYNQAREKLGDLQFWKLREAKSLKIDLYQSREILDKGREYIKEVLD
jgi:hypothetical protein